MPCSICNKVGHNKITCQRKSNAKEIDRKPISSTASIILDSDVNEKTSHLLKLTLSTNKSQLKFASKQNPLPVTNDADEVVQACSDNKDQILRNSEKNTDKNHRETGVSCDEDTFKVSNIGDSNIIRSNAKHDGSRPPPCNICGDSTHESKTCEFKLTYDNLVDGYFKKSKETTALKGEVKNGKVPIKITPWENVKINGRDKDILTKKGLKRFHQGPTQDDGPGYIYMYKQHNPQEFIDEEGDILFKIGCSHQLPRRRVHVQEVRNKEIYDVVHSKQVAYRKLAELLIHLKLKDKGKHCQRPVNDGGTEWFKGKKAELIEDINVVIRFIHVYSPAT